jgi:hypothetical protein
MPKIINLKNYDLKNNFYIKVPDLELLDGTLKEIYYKSSVDLKTWLRFKSNNFPINDIIDNNNQTAFYRGELEFFNLNFNNLTTNVFNLQGNKKRFAFKTLNKESYIVLNNDLIKISENNVDKPFTFSTWLKLESNATSGVIFSKQEEFPEVNNKQFEVKLDIENLKLKIIFYDRNDSLEEPKILKYEFQLTGNFINQKWNHIAFTYNPNYIGLVNDPKIKFYLNGFILTPEIDNNEYFSMKNFDIPFILGMSHLYEEDIDELNNDLQFNLGGGAKAILYEESPQNIIYAETALWSTALSQEQILAILYGISSNIQIEKSGFLNESPRLQIRNLDHATGSYPTNFSHGIPEFTGNYPINFDGNKELNFVKNYPVSTISFNFIENLNKANYINSNIIDEFLFIINKFNNTQPDDRFVFKFVTKDIDLKKDFEENYIIIDATKAKTVNKLLRLFSNTINKLKIGLEAKVNNNVLILRQHIPNTKLFEIDIKKLSFYKIETIIAAINQFDFVEDHLRWPVSLPSDSVWVDANIVTPHRLGDIKAPGNMIIGVSDNHVKFTPGQNLEPYNESRIPNNDVDLFYAVGTEEDLPNFSARLSSKDSFVIDISHSNEENNNESQIYFSVDTEDKKSGFSYYDFKNKNWKLIGNNNELEFYNSNFEKATNSMLATLPSTFWGEFPNLAAVPINNDNLRHLGKPNSFTGFPLSNKFDADNNSTIKLKDYIKAPFLIEKIEFEVNGKLGSYPAYITELNSIEYGDLKFINISGSNRIGKLLEVFYINGSNTIPEIELENNDSYKLKIKFLSGITTAMQIRNAINAAGNNITDIVEVEIIGNPDSPQIIDELFNVNN